MFNACADLVTVDSTTGSKVAPDVIPSNLPEIRLGTGQSEEIDQLARALAMELSESDRRMQLLADLRDSPFPQNRIQFSAYLRGEAGQRIASNMASRMELSGPEMQRHLTAIPELELIVPRMYDRAFWDGDESVIVVGLQDLDAGYSAPLRGFDVLGNEHVIEMWRGIMDRPILMVYPV